MEIEGDLEISADTTSADLGRERQLESGHRFQAIGGAVGAVNPNPNPNPDPDPNPNPNPDPDPDQVRLDRGCERAVLVDWGMARKRESQPGGTISQGSPAYASPEQLTGYNPSSMVAR